MPDYFDTLTWHDNSRAMMDAVIAGTPAFFRGLIRAKIQQWAQEQNLAVVEETTVFRAVEELAPPDMADHRIKPELENLRTK